MNQRRDTISVWHRGQVPERTFSQEIRNTSSAGHDLAAAIRRSLYIQRLANEARSLRHT